MEQKPILHVWINHNHDLVDLTMTTTAKGPGGKVAKTSEVVHTNQKHPFFTLEHGFLPVGQIKLGMHILRADGRVGVVTGWKVVPGTKAMYNLEVAQDHTFTVGDGQWVVHNHCGPQHYEIAPYRDRLAPYEGHHGVLNRWAADNITSYNRMNAPAMRLTVPEHDATRAFFANWRLARTGSVTGYIDWTSVTAPEIQDLAYGMFRAAGAPEDAVANYFRAFHQYIYSL